MAREKDIIWIAMLLDLYKKPEKFLHAATSLKGACEACGASYSTAKVKQAKAPGEELILKGEDNLNWKLFTVHLKKIEGRGRAPRS